MNSRPGSPRRAGFGGGGLGQSGCDSLELLVELIDCSFMIEGGGFGRSGCGRLASFVFRVVILSKSLSLYIYIYTYLSLSLYIYIYIFKRLRSVCGFTPCDPRLNYYTIHKNCHMLLQVIMCCLVIILSCFPQEACDDNRKAQSHDRALGCWFSFVYRSLFMCYVLLMFMCDLL